MVSLDGTPLISTLGGTGLAISRSCKDLETAAKYVEFVGSPTTQKGIYFRNGGQPGHKSAWLDTDVNALSNNYFVNTLPALDRAFLRPRYFGHMDFQDNAGSPIRSYLMNGGDENELLAQLNQLYIESLENTLCHFR
jgi:multiple sugar transport system substrate-binding protein